MHLHGDAPRALGRRCQKAADGQKQLRDGTPWVPALWEAIVARSLAAGPPKPLRFSAQNPNRRRLWLVPLIIAAQYALKVYVFDRVVEEDSWRGDKNGEYDAETQRCAPSSICGYCAPSSFPHPPLSTPVHSRTRLQALRRYGNSCNAAYVQLPTGGGAACTASTPPQSGNSVCFGEG